MATLDEALTIAVAHRQAGRLELAEEICRRILAAEPDHAAAVHLWGVIAYQGGQHQAAVERIARAVAIEPQVSEYHVNLGTAYGALGRFDEAIACYRRALDLRPQDAEVYHHLGVALRHQRRFDEAVVAYRRALELRPGYAKAHNNLGIVLVLQGRLDEACTHCAQALQIDPLYAEAHYNLGLARHLQGRFDEAARSYVRAVELKPDYVQAHHELGQTLQEQGRTAEAVACYRRALHVDPAFVPSYNNLGMVLHARGEFEEALACYRRALELDSTYAAAHNNLGNALKELGQLPDAIASLRRAVALQPDSAEFHANLLLALSYCDEPSADEVAEACAAFDEGLVRPLRSTWRAHGNSRRPERTLRLGFVSDNFERHPVGYFYLRALEGLRGEDCEMVCYATRVRDDDFTARFRAAAQVWREVPQVSDEALAEMIRADGVDMLFDLAGHAAGSRLLLFARRPAPIQIAWAGPCGISAMDYVLADAQLIPIGAERLHRERVLRMPHAYACYEPPCDAPPAGPLPAAERGHVTFGSLNNLAKVTPRVIEAWAEILRRVPTSRLLVRYHTAAESAAVRKRLCDSFAAAGIAPPRIELAGRSPYATRLKVYQGVDLALDPFPFSGCTTTCESLWMGVPVITLPGERYLSRQSLSILRSVGLEEAAARDLPEYIDRAVAWAGDAPRLAAVRASLREQMAGSPLCDGNRFAQELMVLLRGAWRRWCAGSGEAGDLREPPGNQR